MKSSQTSSNAWGLLVAPITNIFPSRAVSDIKESSSDTMPLLLFALSPHKLSISSINMIDGAACCAQLKTLLRDFSASPTYLDNKSEH